MTGSVNSVGPEAVNCEACLKEVHHSQYETEEVNDYVMYFCGIECYRRWREENKPANGD
jgi:hypothetical protein